jgi:hypothetical protein
MPMWAQRSISIWDETTNKRLENIEKFYTNNAIQYPSTINKDDSSKKNRLQTKIESLSSNYSSRY